jgi:hypothetical protein
MALMWWECGVNGRGGGAPGSFVNAQGGERAGKRGAGARAGRLQWPIGRFAPTGKPREGDGALSLALHAAWGKR